MENQIIEQARNNEQDLQARLYQQNIKKILLDYQYIEAISKFDNACMHEHIVQYFTILGMHDPDIVHSIMTIKEMIYCNYSLNDYQDDDILQNSGILRGERKYFRPQYDYSEHNKVATHYNAHLTPPRFHVPIF